MAVQATEDEVLPYLTEEVGIAAVNGPRSVVVSGAEDAVSAVAEVFAEQGRETSRLKVSHAFHSPLMDPMLEEFEEVVGGWSSTTPESRSSRTSPVAWRSRTPRSTGCGTSVRRSGSRTVSVPA